MSNIYFHFVRFFLLIHLRTGLYLWWSRFMRFVHERKWKNTPLPKFDNLVTIEDKAKEVTYQSDQWWTLWDMISYPSRVYFEKKDDCDGTSIFMAEAIQRLARDNSYVLDHPSQHERIILSQIDMLSVFWEEKPWVLGGHAVCVFKYRVWNGETKTYTKGWAWCSNWFGGKIQWTGRDGKPLATLKDVANEIVKPYGDKARFMCYVHFSKNIDWTFSVV